MAMMHPLESRFLLSASGGGAVPFKSVAAGVPVAPPLDVHPTAGLSKGGTLTILGTDSDDEISILRGSKARYYNVMSGSSGLLYFRAASVKRIFLATGAGKDDIQLWDLATPSTVLAGPDDDLVVGSAGADSIYGGQGSDSLEGAGGADSLLGEDGNDTLDGGSGNDSLTGGSGNDTWVASVGADGRGDLFEYEDRHGWNSVPEEVPFNSLSAKVIRQDGKVYLRVLLTMPASGYQVSFGVLEPEDSLGGGLGYDAEIEIDLPFDAVKTPVATTYRMYYDVTNLPRGRHVFAFEDAATGATRSFEFTL